MTGGRRDRRAGTTLFSCLRKGVRSIRLVPMGLIRLYQVTISPDHSPLMTRILRAGVCRFHPTCSQYTYEAIDKYGVIKGGALGVWRIAALQSVQPGGI